MDTKTKKTQEATRWVKCGGVWRWRAPSGRAYEIHRREPKGTYVVICDGTSFLAANGRIAWWRSLGAAAGEIARKETIS